MDDYTNSSSTLMRATKHHSLTQIRVKKFNIIIRPKSSVALLIPTEHLAIVLDSSSILSFIWKLFVTSSVYCKSLGMNLYILNWVKRASNTSIFDWQGMLSSVAIELLTHHHLKVVSEVIRQNHTYHLLLTSFVSWNWTNW